MNNVNQNLRNSFGKVLEKGLINRYGKLPSSAFVAREFNQRAKSEDHINQESARKWLRGLAIPDLNKIFVIQAWLAIDLNSLNVYLTSPSLDNNRSSGNDDVVDKKLMIKQINFLKEALQNTINELSDLEKKNK